MPAPRNLGYVYRGLFFIVLSILWVLWERGSIKTMSELVGSFLVLYGVAVVGTHLLTMGYWKQEASP